jgi:hypothetical protein
MKNSFLFLLAICFSINSFCNENKTHKKNIVVANNTTICVETEYLSSFHKEPQLHWLAYEVIGFLVSEFLPSSFTEICIDLGVSADLCNAGAKAISILLSLQPGNLRIGSTGNIEWKVSRGAKQSYVSFKTDNAIHSKKLKQLLVSYSESCAKDLVWAKIIDLNHGDLNLNVATNTPYHHIMVKNNTLQNIPFKLSVDGSKWHSPNKSIQHTPQGGLFELKPRLEPIEISFGDQSLPFYFNDGVYLSYNDGVTYQITYLRYDTDYDINLTNGRIIFSSIFKR